MAPTCYESAHPGTPGRFTHRHPVVRGRLAKHSRVELHFTPTSASWLNLVEVFFSIVDHQALRRGDFPSVEDLTTAISRFCQSWNERCRPFSWTKPADQSSPDSTVKRLQLGLIDSLDRHPMQA